MTQMRADEWLVAKGLAPTRSQAKDLIRRKVVELEGVPIGKAGQKLNLNAEVTLLQSHGYVGRGAQKLLAALQSFAIDPRNRVAVDLGASTGGFTQVLLESGCQRVYAVDVGHHQLADSLKNHPLVINMEGVNARYPLHLPQASDLVVVDLSFISLRLVWATIKALMGDHGDGVILIKPQFEVGRDGVNQRGVVKDPNKVIAVVLDLLQWGQTQGLYPCQVIRSPICGKKGNREFLAHLRPTPGAKPLKTILRALG